VNPLPHAMGIAWLGQLQAHWQSPLPSGQSQRQEHCIPSPIGGTGPDPDPVGSGTGPDPDAVGSGTGPDPDPVGTGSGPDPVGSGSGPDPDPVGSGTGSCPDPDPVPVVATSAAHFEMVPLPFFTFKTKLKNPSSSLAAPEHFLSHLAVPLQEAPSASKLKEQVQVFLPTFTFSFLKFSARAALASSTTSSEIKLVLMVWDC